MPNWLLMAKREKKFYEFWVNIIADILSDVTLKFDSNVHKLISSLHFTCLVILFVTAVL